MSAPEPMDLGPDPLDPRGDGTIRPGDPLWDVLTTGAPMLAERRDDGLWDVRRFPADGGEVRPPRRSWWRRVLRVLGGSL